MTSTPSAKSAEVPSRGVLTSLQCGRALAALAVVFHHANLSASDLIGGAPGFAYLLGYGTLGVDFFFVLSGFIIYYASVDYRSNARWMPVFLVRRAIRIYLPYWPIGIGVALLYTFLPAFGDGAHRFNWLSSVTLIPTHDLPALIPAWTLQHEVFFYLLFSLLVWLRLLWPGLAIWGVTMALLWWPNGPGSSAALASMNIEFIAGIIAAHLVFHGRVPREIFALTGISVVIAYFVAGPEANSLIFGLGVAFLVACVADMERAGLIRAPTAFVLLGNASYAIYLLHNPLLSLTTRLSAHLVPSWWLAMAVGIIASATLGVLYYLLYERPVLRVAQRQLRRITGAVPGTGAVKAVPAIGAEKLGATP